MPECFYPLIRRVSKPKSILSHHFSTADIAGDESSFESLERTSPSWLHQVPRVSDLALYGVTAVCLALLLALLGVLLCHLCALQRRSHTQPGAPKVGDAEGDAEAHGRKQAQDVVDGRVGGACTQPANREDRDERGRECTNRMDSAFG